MRRVLICGDREWGDREGKGSRAKNEKEKAKVKRLVELLHKKYGKELVIIQGGARGADRLAKIYALQRGIPVMQFDAPWEYLPRAAGPVRNKWMLKIGKPHEIWAFHPCITASKGTKDMAKQAVKAGLLPHVIQ